jgi:hypothetical protein
MLDRKAVDRLNVERIMKIDKGPSDLPRPRRTALSCESCGYDLVGNDAVPWPNGKLVYKR